MNPKKIIVPLHLPLTRSIGVVSIISFNVLGSICILYFQNLLSVILFSSMSGCEKERVSLLLLFPVRKKRTKEEVGGRVVQDTLKMLRNFCLYPLISEIYCVASWLTGWTVRGSNSDRDKRHLFSWTSRPTLGPTQTVRDTVHSPPSSAEVKYEWSCTSNPPLSLHGVDSDKVTFFTFL
jgi:hypothetical protein